MAAPWRRGAPAPAGAPASSSPCPCYPVPPESRVNPLTLRSTRNARDSSQDPNAHARPAPWQLDSLRSNLIALTVVAAVPILGLATYLTGALSRAQQAAVERGLDDTTSALVTSVDRELSSSITTLKALAASRRLDAGDLPGFHEAARRVLESQAESGWLAVQLAAPDGT